MVYINKSRGSRIFLYLIWKKKNIKFYVDSFNQTHSLPHAHTRAKTPTKNEL